MSEHSIMAKRGTKRRGTKRGTKRIRRNKRTRGRTRSRRIRGGVLSYFLSKGASVFTVDPPAPSGNPTLPTNPFSYFQG
jgi:hypothetical protein